MSPIGPFVLWLPRFTIVGNAANVGTAVVAAGICTVNRLSVPSDELHVLVGLVPVVRETRKL